MRYRMPTLPGIYDNSETMCREVWHLDSQGNLEIKQSVSATDVEQHMAHKKPVFQMKWGFFPDLPKD